MKKKIVTISRQYGSGGRDIGENLAKAMGVPCYDEKLIDMVAKESGFAQSFVAEKGERMTGSLLFNIASSLSFANNVFSTNNGVTLQDEIYFTQNRIIKELADKGPCVIVGRCADAILKDDPDCIGIFLSAPLKTRIQMVMKRYGLDEKAAKRRIEQTDRRRADNYRYYTRRIWGMSGNYQMCIDTSLGEDYVLNTVLNLVKNVNRHVSESRAE